MSEQNTAIAVSNTKQETGMTLKAVTDRVNLVHNVLDKVMLEGTHYGTVPGCGSKKVLLKPGADVLAMTFKLSPQFGITKTDMNDGHREYDVTCSMYGPDGSMLGQGVGSASTMEKKYRYRKDDKGKKIENEDIADVYNTVLKIAKKRAHIDATLTVTGAADLFTQDLIENEDDPKKEPITQPTEKKLETPAPESTPSPDNLPGHMHANGILAKVEAIEFVKKTGKDAGKKGLRYKLELDNGDIFGTFSQTVFDCAQTLQGESVVVEYVVDGKYKTAVDVSPCQSGN